MITLDDLKAATANIFECYDNGDELKAPTPPVIWRDKIVAFEENNLVNQKAGVIYEMRKWQAVEMGFEEIRSEELVELLMGSEATNVGVSDERQYFEWVYDHHTDNVFDKARGWGSPPVIFTKAKRNGIFGRSKIEWQCQFGRLDYLKQEIPYGVMLRIAECKKLKIFNAFNVLAPMEAWKKKTDIDPIIVATIWELPYQINIKGNEHNDAGSATHYFLAQW